jgi:fucose permease
MKVSKRKGIVITVLIVVIGCIIMGVSAPIYETFLGATLILIGVCAIGVGGLFFNYFMYMHNEVEGQKENKNEKEK